MESLQSFMLAPVRQASGLQSAELVCAGRSVPYTIRPSRRARSFGMLISPQTGVVVTVPAAGHQPRALERFLRRHERWLLRHLDRLARVAARMPPSWPFGDSLPFQGQRCSVELTVADGPRQVVLTPDRRLIVRITRPGLDGARRLLRRWYMEQALRYSEGQVQADAAAMGVSWRRVRIGDQRRRWGSCSPQGSLSFNYRLIMAPPPVFDYVIIHELAHRLDMSHSRGFWAIVARHCPSYRERIAWLKSDGSWLGL